MNKKGKKGQNTAANQTALAEKLKVYRSFLSTL